MPRSRLARPTTSIGIVVCAAILALHAALLPEAHWRGDDFIAAAFARDFGWRYLWQARIDGWSPRPLSELVFYAYGRIAAARAHPLTVPFLGLLWTVLIATTLITLRPARQAATRILIGLATACMFLLGHPVAELFFWPAGAVAYLTTLAAVSLALFLLIDRRETGLAGTAILSASLAACAASSETGALAAVPLALTLAASSPGAKRRTILLAPALLTAGFVFWTLAHHRMVSSEAVTRPTLSVRLLDSLEPVPRVLFADLVSIWPAKFCLALGLRWCAGPALPPAQPRAALAGFAASLLAACVLSIVAGNFQFGAACCQRHDSLRQCWMVLAITALAVASLSWQPSPGFARLGPAMLTLACLLGLAPRLTSLLSDYRLMPQIVGTRESDWQSGRDHATSHMTFRLPPPVPLAGGLDVRPGRYREPASDSWTAHGIMQFFGKQSITIVPPPPAPGR